VGNAEVFVYRVENETLTAVTSGSSDERGAFSFSGIPEGTYTLLVEKLTYWFDYSAPIRLGPSDATDVRLHAWNFKIPSCRRVDVLTHSPLAMDSFSTILPLGNLNPPSHIFPTDHSYFMLKLDSNPPFLPKVTPIFAPATGYITSIQVETNLETGIQDIGLLFQPCQEFVVEFGHVTGLSESVKRAMAKIVDQAPDRHCSQYTSPSGQRIQNCSAQMRMRVRAGEQIGFAGGSPRSLGLDLGARDYRKPPAEVNYRFGNGVDRLNSPYVVCPTDGYALTSPVRAQLESRLGSGQTLRTVEPKCGTIFQDIKGRAQGDWFYSLAPGERGTELALVHDNVDPTLGVFSIGRSIPSLPSGLYFYRPSFSGVVNLDFSLAGADGKTYCYDVFQYPGNPFQGAVLIQMETETQLRIEGFYGQSCSSLPVFSSEAVVFIR
jgi:hypothetical protein